MTNVMRVRRGKGGGGREGRNGLRLWGRVSSINERVASPGAHHARVY